MAKAKRKKAVRSTTKAYGSMPHKSVVRAASKRLTPRTNKPC